MYITDFIDKLNKKKQGVEGIYTQAYYSLGGLIAGMIISDIWERLDLPGNNKKLEFSLLSGTKLEKSAYEEDKLYQNMIAGLVIALEMVGVKGAAASGTGMLLGFNYVATARERGYIGGTPSP